MNTSAFQTQILAYAAAHKRDLPWRTPYLQPDNQGHLNFYKVFLSEVMLQQTQVPRVIQKYHEFLEAFPTMHALAQATLPDVLRVWQGLGYNRRGKYLWQAAKQLYGSCSDFVIPAKAGIQNTNQSHSGTHLESDAHCMLTPTELDALPGIGPATAASIYCFTYNKPIVFIETNIRKVFLFHFFSERDEVGDDELIPFIHDTMDVENPREWYYALMDYGSYLSKIVPNPNRKSKQYVRQAKFEGSDRQIRGRLLRDHLAGKKIALQNERERAIWKVLQNEGLIV
jgi:A/G-specific adenine glycosylase